MQMQNNNHAQQQAAGELGRWEFQLDTQQQHMQQSSIRALNQGGIMYCFGMGESSDLVSSSSRPRS
jgi:hypothetical protein